MTSLLEAIRSAFSPKKDLSQLQAQIANIVQSSNESVLQYGIRVSEVLRHTLDTIEKEFPREATTGMKLGATQNAISCFIRDLKQSIETRMTVRKADCLQTIINIAMTVETEVECLSNLRDPTKNEMPLRSHPYARDNIRNKNEHHRVHKVEGNIKRNNSPDLQQIKCYGCRELAHYKSSCPQRSNIFKKVIGKCEFCGGPNYYEENCLAKRDSEIRQKKIFEMHLGKVQEKSPTSPTPKNQFFPRPNTSGPLEPKFIKNK